MNTILTAFFVPRDLTLINVMFTFDNCVATSEQLQAFFAWKPWSWIKNKGEG